MKAQQIRETFLDFFHKKKHKIVKSSSLFPKDDPTLLFTNAGMNQFKNIFLGLEKKTYKRAASVQKCMRVSGKHNDLEQVGKTNKHHTFFEMLGNFSFGDYFKREAIEYAWELITEIYKLDPRRLYITIFKEDDEAFKIWNNGIGISADKIFLFGRKDNYWAMGDTGPCGPCSEIHYDLGANIEEGDTYKLIEKGSNRFLELWNLVFMQYYQDDNGNVHPLPSPSIDTGMGLERLTASLQGKLTDYDTDLFSPIIEAICNLSQKEYPVGEDSDISIRIIADHARAVTFMIGDGIMPSNDGRGYVLRRLIRRAFRQGNSISIKEPFLYKLVGVVGDIMKDAYPELLYLAQYISRVCMSEEKRFSMTLSSGIRTFNQYIGEIKKAGKRNIPGEKLFKLYDTYGFPLDLSKELAEERNLDIDEKGFYKELDKQRKKARLAWKGEAKLKAKKVYKNLKDLHVKFVGYESHKIPEAKILAIMKKGTIVNEIKEGEEGEVFLNKTPFYAEAGGQVGDSGILKNSYFSALVLNAYYPIPQLIAHEIKAISGKIKTGDYVEAGIDTPRRNNISKNHTTTHLLHASLREILGDHVKQSGSLLSPLRLRFDFTHYASLNSKELKHIESLVNKKIRENIPVQIKTTTLDQGLREGATAIFEEKYGETVRMVTIGEFSKELCGGVHVQRTGEIGLFKILSESSIAAGMRRIEALTGEEALKYVQEMDDDLIEIQKILNTQRKEILEQISRFKDSLKEKDIECRSLRQKLANIKYQAKEVKTKKVNGIPVLVQKVEGLNNAELRELADSLKQRLGSGVVVLGSSTEEKVFVVASVTKDLTHRIKANEFIKNIAPVIQGGGGGRPDFAQAGGTKPKKLKEALEKTYDILERMLQ